MSVQVGSVLWNSEFVTFSRFHRACDEGMQFCYLARDERESLSWGKHVFCNRRVHSALHRDGSFFEVQFQ